MTKYRADIEAAAAAHGLDPDLVEAVVCVESSGKTHAYRYEPAFWRRYLADTPEYADANPERVAASYGLMQVMYTTAKDHGFSPTDPEFLFVPRMGLDYGCRHLARCLAWSGGNVEQALAFYNGGRKGNEAPPYRNAPYARKVLALVPPQGNP